MSTQEFKVGDRVVVTDDHSRRLTKGSQHVVSSVSGDRVMLEGMAGYYWARRFEKVEPEWVVGQQVSGDDYKRLPVGAVADDMRPGMSHRVTREAGSWAYDSGMKCAPNHPRTLTHLPDAPEPEDTDEIDSLGGLPADDDTPVVRAFVASRVKRDMPEDTDDVEPEPLKVGGWYRAWVQVQEAEDEDNDVHVRAYLHCGDWASTMIRNDAIVRPGAGQQPPWIKPAQCTSLVECDEGAGVFYLRCNREPHNDDAHRLSDSGIDDLAWTDAEEYGRVEVRS